MRSGELNEDRAADSRVDFDELAISRSPHQLLADRIWELRSNLTAYDAAYVALAGALAVPQVTVDRRMADAPGHGAAVEVHGEASLSPFSRVSGTP